VTTQAHSDDDPRPVPPARPSEEECCKGGCDRCVFDLYDDALERYEAELKAWEERRQRAWRGEPR